MNGMWKKVKKDEVMYANLGWNDKFSLNHEMRMWLLKKEVHVGLRCEV